MEEKNEYIKGRGAQINTENRFIKKHTEKYYDDLPTHEEREDLAINNAKTKFIDVHPKTILNKVTSPDLGFGYSMNPYQGCEHGCIYCYARNSHEYWDFSPGLDFEQNIMVKKNAHSLLRDAFMKKGWEPTTIMLSGNTDCYQPIERKMQITRKILEVCAEFSHPVSIITKNTMIERDMDILQELSKDNLVHVTLSLTTLNEDLKRIMEPRTASVRNILRTLETFAKNGIPVNINAAPMIPALNDHELPKIIKTVAGYGASRVSYIVVRLNHEVATIFEDWIRKNFPDRAENVLKKTKYLHGGNLFDSRYGKRMSGEGIFAEMIKKQYQIAMNKYMSGRSMPAFNKTLFYQKVNKQMSLF
jgi:DNA repair photolyase